ncbi:MAG: type II toxin-antitoxin system HicB family antitoxin [Nitrosopumilus sp.]|nr:type II toxin-antitoxin system HicB family antitoxin [Nitrosopumilus sp.]
MASDQNDNTSVKRQFTVRYQTEEEGGFSGQCLELPGAISQGETIEELIENMKDAISLILESIKEDADLKDKKSLVIELGTNY